MKTFRSANQVLIFFGILMLALSAYAAADSSNTQHRQYWGNVGFGGATVPRGLGESDGGMAIGFGLSYRIGHNLFTARYVAAVEIKLDIWGTSSPESNVWDVGFMYGRVATATYGMAAFSAGASVMGASSEGRNVPLRLGLPVEIQLFWTPFTSFGFGLVGFADYNSYKSFAGVLFCVQLRRNP